MEPNKVISTCVLLLTLFSSAFTVPIQWESSSCAQTCNPDPLLMRYDVGKTYYYELETNTQINYGSYGQGSQSVGIRARVELSQHSPCEMSLQLRDVQLTGVENQFDLKQQLESEPFQFGFDDGKIVGVCPSVEDELWVINVKKSIISALQMTAKSTQTKSIVLETDILGNCETVYEPSQRYTTIVIQKSKALNRCTDRQRTQIGFFPRQYGLNEVISTSIPIVNSSLNCFQTIDKDMIVTSTCQEQQLLWPSNIAVESNLDLKFQKQITGLSAKRVQQFEKHQLLMSSKMFPKSGQQEWDESGLTSTLRRICSQMKNDVLSPETTELFPQLVQALQQVSRSSIQRVYSSVENGEICSSPKLRDLFLDASALATSEGSVQVLVNSYKSQKISKTRASYLFSLMAFTSNPSQQSLKTLLPILQSRDTPQQIVLGISGLIHNLKAQQSGQSENDQQNSQVIRQSIDAIVERIQNSRNPSEIISLIKSLENIGVQSHQTAKQLLVEFAKNSRQKQGVRVSAIQALTEASDNQIRQQLLEVFKQQSEPNEVRLAAYKTIVMSGASKQQLEQIRDQIRREENRNENVVNYVRSHQKNLRETSDPHKRDVLPSDAPQFKPPENRFGNSRNMEISYLHEASQIGFALETDLVVEKDSPVPRLLTINVEVPALGKDLQLVQLQVRQVGLDKLIQQKIKKSSNNLPKLVKEIVEIFVSEINQIQSQNVVLQMSVKIDEKTVLFLDAKDVDTEFYQVLKQLKQELEDRIKIDRAFAFIPVNTRIELPTSNGLPMYLRLNTTVVTGLKTDLKLDGRQLSSATMEALVLPSFAVQTEAAIEIKAKKNKKALEFVSRLSFAPVLDARAQVRDGRIVDVKINLPKEKQSIVKFEAHVYERDQSGQRKAIRGNSQKNHKICTQALNKPLGIAFCSELSHSKPLLSMGPINAEISIVKTDKSMKSFEMSLEMPPMNAKEVQVFRAAVNTPNSEVDREISLELQLTNPRYGRKEAKVQMKSPWKRWSASASIHNEDKEKAVQLEVVNDGQKQFSLDAGIENQVRGQKKEYRPRIRIQARPGSEPINLQGSVSVSKGRKNQLQINLEGNQKQFLKGSFVKEGEKNSNEFRVSSDVTLNLPGIELRVSGLGDKAKKHMISDLTVEYKLNNQKKESVKLSAKLQNLTQSQLTKMSAFGELTSTQFPKFNFHLAYNLLSKPFEHIENELTVAWRQQLKDKIHMLQVSKYTQDYDSNEHKVENTLVIEATPLDVNYELRANAEFSRRGAEGPKYNVELIGKDRTGRKENDIRGQFQYRHISRSPLHLSMDASFKSTKREMSYHDQLKEVAPNEYNGKTSVQWQADKIASLEYNYKIKSDSKQNIHHEIEMELKTPRSRYPIRHSGLLKMTRDDFHLKSKVNYEGNQLYNWESVISRKGPSKVNIDLKGIQTKLDVNPYSIPQLAALEVSSDEYHHKSNLELVPRSSFALKSDTKRNARNVFAVESRISKTYPSRIVINSDPFEGRVDLDTISDRKSANIEMRSPRNQWSHATNCNYDPINRFASIKSNTESRGKRLVSVDCQLARRDRSFLNVEMPLTVVSMDATTHQRQKAANLELKTTQVSHKSSVQWSPSQMKLVSNTLKNRQQVADFDYQYNDGLHSLNLDTQDINAQLEGQLVDQPFGKIGLKSKRSQYDHMSKIRTEPNKIMIESRTEKRGNNLANLNALLSRDEESSIRLVTPQVTTQLKAKPYESTKFEWNCPKYDHVSQVQWKKPVDEWQLDSRTQWKNEDDQQYDFFGKYSPRKHSLISVKIPSFDSQIQVIRSDRNPKLKVEFQGKHMSVPVNHVTELEADQKSNHYSLKSRTDRAVNGENILSLDANYYHNSQSNPSNFEVKLGKQLEAKVRANPFNSKQKTLNIDAKSGQYNHITDIQMDSNSLAVNSRTDNMGQNIAKIDSYLTPKTGQKSYFSIVTQNSNANVEYEPQNRAKIELKVDPFGHQSELIADRDGYKLQSLTTRSGQQLVNLNSALNRRELASHLNLNSPLIDTEVVVNPSQNSAKLKFKTNSLDHKSNVRFIGNKFQLQSQTNKNNKLIAHLNTELSRDHDNQFELEIPHFESKSNVNLVQKTASIDYRSKLRNGRHLLASVAINPNSNNGFHADMSWDADKDPNQRLILDFIARREGSSWGSNQQLVVSMEANYAQNLLKFLSQMNTKNPVNGPHEMTIDYIPHVNPSKESLTLKANYVIQNGEAELKWQYMEANQRKFSAQLNAKSNNEHYGNQGFVATLQTNAPKNPELEYKMTINQRKTSDQWFAEVKANQGLSQQYKVSVDLKQESHDRVKGVVNMDTPTIHGQSVNFLLEKSEKQFTLNAINQNGKQMELKSGLTENSANFDMKSNVDQIPSIRANAYFVKNKEISITVDSDAERMVDISAKLNGHDLKEGRSVNARLESVFTPTLEFNAKAKKDLNEVSIETNAKYNFKEIFATEMKVERSGQSWSGRGAVSGHGAELARASLESQFGSNSLQYVLSANGNQFYPIEITFSASVDRVNNEKKSSIKLCSNDKCVDMAGAVKMQKWASIPQKFMFSMSKLGSEVEIQCSMFEQIKQFEKYHNSILNLSTNKKTLNKIRNQLLVSINSHSLGFDSITTEREHNAQDVIVKFYLPSNKVMQIRTDYANEGRGHQLKMDFKPDSRNENPLIESFLTFNNKNENLSAKLELSSEKFRRNPKVISFSWEQPNRDKPLDAKLFIDVTPNPNNALTIESHAQTLNNENRTLSVSISTRDRQAVDFSSTVHVSRQSAGILWQNVNRNGHKKNGFYFLKSMGKNLFEAIVRDSENFLRIEGNYAINHQSKEKAIDLSITDENTNNKREVRLSVNGECVRFYSKKNGNQEKRTSLCLNTQNQKVFALSAESTESNGQKSVDLSFEIDARSQKAMKVHAHWNPKIVKQILKSLAQNFEQSASKNSIYSSELAHELRHKSGLIAKQLAKEVIIPLFSLFADESGDLFQEMAKNFRPINHWVEKLQQFTPNFAQIVDHIQEKSAKIADQMVPDWIAHSVQAFYRSLLRSARKQCKYSSACYKLSYVIENLDSSEIIEMLWTKIYELAQKTHRFALTTSGKLIRSLPAVPVPESLREYKKSIEQSVETIVESNQELKSFVENFKQIFEELVKENIESIDWSRVKQSTNELASLIFSNSSWASSSRVLVWDPSRGEIQIEVRSPVVHSRKLRSVMQTIKTNSTKNSKIQQWIQTFDEKVIEPLENRFY